MYAPSLYKKRRALTLIELLLSLSFCALLTTSLFFWYRHLSQKKYELAQLTLPYKEEQCAYQRLCRVFAKVELPFFTEEGVVFRFDRGIANHPRLSDRVLGKLYYDAPTQTLCLGIWPDLTQTEDPFSPSETLLLLDQVESCLFSLYSPPPPFALPVDPEGVGQPKPLSGWQEVWLSDYETLPALIKIEAIHRGKPWEIFFDLNQPILYPLP